MPFGPQKLLPVGTYRENRLRRLCEKIDNKIISSEGPSVVVKVWDVNFYYKDLKEDIVSIYREAGWHYVYWNCKFYFQDTEDEVILSNDFNHKILKPGLKTKRKCWWPF